MLSPAPRVQADGFLLVTNRGDDSILRFHATTGAFIDVFVASGSGQLLGVDLGIARGPDGNIYVNSFLNHAVMRYDGTTGAPLPSPGNSGAQFVASESGGLLGTEAIQFGPDGNLYVASQGEDSIKLYDGATGGFLRAFVPAGSGGLTSPNDLHFGPDGNLYVDNYDFPGMVWRYDATSGEPLPAPGKSAADFTPPQGGDAVAAGFAFGPDGNLYVAFNLDFFGLGFIEKYNGQTGDDLGIFVPSGSGGVFYIEGIAFGPDGNLYVTDLFDQVLRYNGTTGAFLDVFISPGNGLNSPAGLLFVPGPTP
jgi:DNA-binding beta-propeller fold protein YncE